MRAVVMYETAQHRITRESDGWFTVEWLDADGIIRTETVSSLAEAQGLAR